jgi:hypothetical protein
LILAAAAQGRTFSKLSILPWADLTHKDGTVTFPRSNAIEVIPTAGKKGFACNLEDNSEKGDQKNMPIAQLIKQYM